MIDQYHSQFEDSNALLKHKLIAFLERRLGKAWLSGKRVLELGCGHADIGGHLATLGADVTCIDLHEEQLRVARERHPLVTTIQADLNHQWPVHGSFDLVLHLGLIPELADIEFSLDKATRCANQVVVESEVLDSLDHRANLLVTDLPNTDNGLPYARQGRRPSAAFLERLFDRLGFYAHRLASDECNVASSADYQYNWPCKETLSWNPSHKRLWMLHRKSMIAAPRSDNISIVVQGPVVGLNDQKPRKQLTQRCIKSLRRFLPQAEIIVSTWQDMATDGLDYDQLVQSYDPGGICCDDVYNLKNNINRQIVSAHSGLTYSSRPYSLKFRSDLVLRSDRFLSYWDRYPLRDWSYRFTAQRMLSSSVFARRFAGPDGKTTRLPFHPSDFIFFGFTQDVQNLFDIPHTVEPDTSRWFDKRARPEGVLDCYEHSHCRFFPEQHLWMSFLRKFIDLPMKHRLDLAHPCVAHDEPSQLNNLIVLDQSQWNFDMPKYILRQFVLPSYDWDGLYRHAVWLEQYCRAFQPSVKTSPTYDSRMRQLFHDGPLAKRIERRSPRLMRYLHKRAKKSFVFR